MPRKAKPKVELDHEDLKPEELLVDEAKPKEPEIYPTHAQAFETFYWLGDRRSVREAALIRFRDQYPTLQPDSPEFSQRFEAFYASLKRFARIEKWKEWVEKKDSEERRSRDRNMQERIIKSQENLMGYRGLIQQAVFAFSKRASRSARMIVEIINLADSLMRPDLPEETRKRMKERKEVLDRDLKENGVQIKSFKDLNDCISLDVELGKTIEGMPSLVFGDREKIGEGAAEKLDKLVEFFRRKAGDGWDLLEEHKEEGEDEGGKDGAVRT